MRAHMTALTLAATLIPGHGCDGPRPAPPPPERMYRLPFPARMTAIVGQGNFGVFGLGSHVGEYAIDFVMPIDTPILAARGGRVVDARGECPDVNCPLNPDACCGNYVEIRHDDGTRAIYYHLRKNGPCVAVGMEVAQGDVIGRSGNTGYSLGPHLHFAVFAAEPDTTSDRGTDGSVQVQFEDVPGDGVPRFLQYVTSGNLVGVDRCAGAARRADRLIRSDHPAKAGVYPHGVGPLAPCTGCPPSESRPRACTPGIRATGARRPGLTTIRAQGVGAGGSERGRAPHPGRGLLTAVGTN